MLNMTNAMKSDCQKLEETSKYIKHWIIRQPAVKEESVTDWLLFDISEKIAGIKYKAFDRHEESRRTGADWEWWFLFPAFSFKLRVQAKKVEKIKNNYPKIAYPEGRGLQIGKLMSDSLKNNSMPVYAFYTSEMGNVRCRLRKNDEGVYIAGAGTVYRDFVVPGWRKIMAVQILAKSIPLSCFFCCPLCSQDSNGFIRFLMEYYPDDISLKRAVADESYSDNKREILGYHSEVPVYVSSFIEYSSDYLLDSWEKEHEQDLLGINALVVYDAR